MTETENRRPLASRGTSWAKRTTQYLATTRITPNQISIGSMITAALAGLCFWAVGGSSGVSRVALLILAALFCQLRLLCNLFDGMVAVEAGKRTSDGLVWNEFPDRFADIFILIGIGYGIGMPALAWAAATFSVLTAYVRELGVASGQDHDFIGPMAKQHRMAVVTVAALVSLFEPLFDQSGFVLTIALWIVAIGALLTSVRRVIRLLGKF